MPFPIPTFLLTLLLSLFFLIALIALTSACKEGELKCGAAQDDGTDGGIFKCTNGYWKMWVDCSKSEKCFMTPVPHCRWDRNVGEDGKTVEEDKNVEDGNKCASEGKCRREWVA